MEKIRVFTWGLWSGFDFRASLFGLALADRFHFDMVDDPRNCDLVFESFFKPREAAPNWYLVKLGLRAPAVSDILRASGTPRILFSGEARDIPGGVYDGVISHDLWTDGNHYRLPLWVLYCRLYGESRCIVAERECGFELADLYRTAPALERQKFASAIFSNKCHRRMIAARRLSRLGQVDIFGRTFGRPVDDKMILMRDYRFNLCFENTIEPGYVTEKALQAKIAGCIPLWWGDPTYRADFNERSIVNAYEYDCDFERIMDEADLRAVTETPLLSAPPPDHRRGLASFFEDVLRGDGSKFGAI